MDLNFSLPRLSQGACRLIVVLSSQLTIDSWLDGRHVVFGEVLEGYDIVDKIQNVAKGAQDRPVKAVEIVKSGELEVPAEGIHAEL